MSRYSLVTAILATVTLAISAVMSVTTYFNKFLFGRYEFIPVVTVAAVTFISAIVVTRAVYGRHGQGIAEHLRSAPIAGALALAALALFGAIGSLSFLAHASDGTPHFEASRRRYELLEHGSVHVVSRTSYDAALVRIDRGVLGFGMIFLVVSTVLLYAALKGTRARVEAGSRRAGGSF